MKKTLTLIAAFILMVGIPASSHALTGLADAGVPLNVPPAMAQAIESVAGLKCPRKGSPVVSVRWTSKPTKYFYTKSNQQLTAEAVKEGSSFLKKYFHGTGAQVAGTASSPARIDVRTRFGGLTNGKQSCTWPEQVEVTITYSPEIHISSDLKKGTCRYNEVLAHEHTHIEISRKIASEFTQPIKLAVAQTAGRLATSVPINPGDIDNRQKKMSQQIMTSLDAVTDKYAREERIRQQSFDRREYGKDSQCK